VNTGAVRGILVVVAVIVGLIVLSRAFPDSAPAAGQAPASGQGDDQPADGESPAAGATTAPPSGPRQVQGVIVQVLNGTEESGLAAETKKQLEPFGYQVVEVGNVGSGRIYKRTTLFYREDAQSQAQQLITDFFPGAKLEEATNNLNPEVQVTIVVGVDQVT
jgi:hypothetical protein